MVRRTHNHAGNNRAEIFFLSTLFLWFISVFFEIFFNKRRELVGIVAGCCFYLVANWIIRYYVSRDALFVNTSVSLLHSAITSTSVIIVIGNQWITNGSHQLFDHSQLVDGTWPWAYPALCFSCGYFAYDQWDMLHYQLYGGLIPSILVHHLILLICFTLALYRNVAINYLILTLVCELNSIFLHVRRVRRMAGIRNAKSKIVMAEWFLNWITFTIARCASHVLITIKLIKDAHKFGKGVELPFALFGMAGMNLLNIFLGIDLFHAFRRERNPPQNHRLHHE